MLQLSCLDVDNTFSSKIQCVPLLPCLARDSFAHSGFLYFWLIVYSGNWNYGRNCKVTFQDDQENWHFWELIGSTNEEAFRSAFTSFDELNYYFLVPTIKFTSIDKINNMCVLFETRSCPIAQPEHVLDI